MDGTKLRLQARYWLHMSGSTTEPAYTSFLEYENTIYRRKKELDLEILTLTSLQRDRS